MSQLAGFVVVCLNSAPATYGAYAHAYANENQTHRLTEKSAVCNLLRCMLGG